MFFTPSHFSDVHLIFFIAAGLVGIFSIAFFVFEKHNVSILLLFCCALILRLTINSMDPYLNLWDEQYHALVAKNMVENPFKPMLIKHPVLPFNVGGWTGNHIWIHKQPLFLWQIAISYKIFGINEFGLRFPSALMTAIIVLFIYSIGKNISNKQIGFCGALLFAFSNFQIEVASGKINTDHNDVAFMFYVIASIWAWVIYMRNKKLNWALLVGIFSGLSILVKWLPGLIVFAGWGISIIMNKENRRRISEYKNIFISFISAILVMAPWQVYKSLMFPLESAAEYSLYSRHITEALDGHGGDIWFHFDLIGEQFGKLAPFVLIPSFFILNKVITSSYYKIGLLINITLFYFFFTITATKMPLFCMPVAPLLFLSLGALLERVIRFSFFDRKLARILSMISLIAISYSYLDMKSIEQNHTNKNNSKNSYRAVRTYNAEIARAAARILPSEDYVVFNAGALNSILIMFYAGNTSYDWYPDERTYQDLKNRKIKLAVFADEKLPDYLAKDNSIIRLDMQMIGY